MKYGLSFILARVFLMLNELTSDEVIQLVNGGYRNFYEAYKERYK